MVLRYGGGVQLLFLGSHLIRHCRIDTSTSDEFHVAGFKSYHTTTPNGYDLQISATTRGTRNPG